MLKGGANDWMRLLHCGLQEWSLMWPELPGRMAVSTTSPCTAVVHEMGVCTMRRALMAWDVARLLTLLLCLCKEMHDQIRAANMR